MPEQFQLAFTWPFGTEATAVIEMEGNAGTLRADDLFLDNVIKKDGGYYLEGRPSRKFNSPDDILDDWKQFMDAWAAGIADEQPLVIAEL